MPHILIADDHPICRTAVQMAASAVIPDLQVTEAASMREAETALAGGTSFNFIVLDMMMPDTVGFSGLSRVLKLAGKSPVAVLSSQDDATTMARARDLGASAFISKALPVNALAHELLALNRRSGQGSAHVSVQEPGIAPRERPASGDPLAGLTASQRRVMRELRDGALNKQIAHKLGLSEATVKSHLAAAFRKLGVTNRTQAVLLLQGSEAPEVLDSAASGH